MLNWLLGEGNVWNPITSISSQNAVMQERSSNRAQRIVIVIGLGLAFLILGGWLTSLSSHLPYGSVAFSNFSSGNVVEGIHPWLRSVIWLVLIAIWVGSSFRLLGTGTSARED